MTFRVIEGGDSPGPEQAEQAESTPPVQSELPPNNNGSELYHQFVLALQAGGYTNQAVLSACACLAAHAVDSAGWDRRAALPEIIRMYFQIQPVKG